MTAMSMSKPDMARILTERGYPSEVIEDVVQVTDAVTKKQYKEIKAIIKEVGYNASYSVRLKYE